MSTPMVTIDLSASVGVMVIRKIFRVHQVGTGLDGITVRQDCDEARPDVGSARLLIRPVVVDQAEPVTDDDKSNASAPPCSGANPSMGSAVVICLGLPDAYESVGYTFPNPPGKLGLCSIAKTYGSSKPARYAAMPA